MAKLLSKNGINTNQSIEAWHITQSIDAFRGLDDYDINISGSLTVTGSTLISGSLTVTGSLNIHSNGVGLSLSPTPGSSVLKLSSSDGSNTKIEVDGINTGQNSIVDGKFASVFGSGSRALGTSSIAEGIRTLASGIAAHSMGVNTTASGFASISTGVETDSTGTGSFTAGSGSQAVGYASTALGIGAWASASGQVVIGHYNAPFGSPTSLFVVGGGNSNDNRGNIIEVYGGSGSAFKAIRLDVSGQFNDPGYFPDPGLSIYGSASFYGTVRAALGTKFLFNSGSSIQGLIPGAGTPFTGDTFIKYDNDNTVLGKRFATFGFDNNAGTKGANNFIPGSGSYILATTYFDALYGNHIQDLEIWSSPSPYTGSTQFAIIQGSTKRMGILTNTPSSSLHVSGGITSISITSSDITIYNRISHGGGDAQGSFSIASGQSTSAVGVYSHTEGYNTLAQLYAHAEGGNTTANTYFAHSEGENTLANSVGSHAEGGSTIANAPYAHSEGSASMAQGTGSHAEGFGTFTSGAFSHAEGYGSYTIGLASHAGGLNTIATEPYQFVIGQYNITSSGNSAFIIGNGENNSRSNLLFASGSEVQITGSLNVTGSLNINSILTLTPHTSWPPSTGSIILSGSLAISGSGAAMKLMLYNGTEPDGWVEV